MLNRAKGCFICILLVFALYLPSRAIAATSPFNLTTSPLPVLLSTKPGETISTNLRIENNGSSSIDLKVGLKKFKASGTSGEPQLLNRASGDDYFDWVSFSKTSFTAEPQVWNQITMTIKTPPTAALGYYYAVTFTPVNAVGKSGSSGGAINAGEAILVLLDVQVPGEKKQLQVTSFSADHGLYEYLPATFSVEIKNTGNIYTAPSGTVFIYSGSKVIAKLDLNQASGNILPGTTRTYTATWRDGFPVFENKLVNGQPVMNKKGQPEMKLKWDFSKANHLRFGHYRADLVAAYDNGTNDVPMEGTLSFWVVPWKMLPVIILALVLVGIGLWSSGKGFWQRINKRLRRGSNK